MTADESKPRPSLRQRMVWRLEYGATLAFAALLRSTPAAVAAFLARSIGDLLFLLLRKRVRTGDENLRAALPELAEDPAARRRVLRGSFRHFATVPVELLRLPRTLRRRPAESILEVLDRHHLDGIQARGGACIYLTGHVGNWEVTGALCERLGYGMTSIGRGVANPHLHRWLKEQRCRFGQVVSDKDGASRDILRVLRKGGKVGMLLDQHAGRHGIRVPYFGRLASTFASAAHLARRLELPLLPGFSYRDGALMKFRLQLFPPIWPDPSLPAEEDHYRLTRYYTQCLEAIVREHPEQYLWFHRRWRPGGEEPRKEWLERYAAGVAPDRDGTMETP